MSQSYRLKEMGIHCCRDKKRIENEGERNLKKNYIHNKAICWRSKCSHK